MRFYKQPHRFYCGVDLHARTMYVCILDQPVTSWPTKICLPSRPLSLRPSRLTARAWSSPVSVCSAGTG